LADLFSSRVCFDPRLLPVPSSWSTSELTTPGFGKVMFPLVSCSEVVILVRIAFSPSLYYTWSVPAFFSFTLFLTPFMSPGKAAGVSMGLILPHLSTNSSRWVFFLGYEYDYRDLFLSSRVRPLLQSDFGSKWPSPGFFIFHFPPPGRDVIFEPVVGSVIILVGLFTDLSPFF